MKKKQNSVFPIKKTIYRAEKFFPHVFANKITANIVIPKIFLSKEAYEDMYFLVDEAQNEIVWLGNVEKISNDFLIKEIFLLKQEADATFCEISANDLANWAQTILAERSDGIEIINSIRFWGHSHVNMGTSPSGQDVEQLEILSGSCDDFFIRGILNKSGRMEFTIFLLDRGIEIHDVEWRIFQPVNESRREKWQREIEEKVSERVYTTPVYPAGCYPYNQQNFKHPLDDKLFANRKYTGR